MHLIRYNEMSQAKKSCCLLCVYFLFSNLQGKKLLLTLSILSLLWNETWTAVFAGKRTNHQVTSTLIHNNLIQELPEIDLYSLQQRSEVRVRGQWKKLTHGFEPEIPIKLCSVFFLFILPLSWLNDRKHTFNGKSAKHKLGLCCLTLGHRLKRTFQRKSLSTERRARLSSIHP